MQVVCKVIEWHVLLDKDISDYEDENELIEGLSGLIDVDEMVRGEVEIVSDRMVKVRQVVYYGVGI